MKRSAPSLMLILTLLAACSAGSGPGSSAGSPGSDPSDGGDTGGVEHPTGGDRAIFTIHYAGGMIPAKDQVNQTPAFVLLGDGRVIVPGAQTLQFPGPALSPLLERTLTEAGIQEVLAAIGDTALFTADLDLRGAQNSVTDASDTIFTLDADDRQVTVSVYGLGQATPMPDQEAPQGMTSAEMQAHQALQGLLDRMLQLDTWLPAGSWEAEGWKPYEPEAVRLYVRDATGEPIEGGDMPEQVRTWPTDADPAAFGEDAKFGDGTRCGVVEGDEAATWFEELQAANQMTLWTLPADAAARFRVTARPLLPHEEAICPDLGGV